MCTIGFTIEWEDLDTDLIFDHEGQYREQGSTEWIPFQFDLNNPETPDIVEEGIYEMRIRIFDGRAWSEWFYKIFGIGCAAFTIGYDDSFKS